MARRKTRSFKIPTKAMSYRDLIKYELDKYRTRVKFTFHEYWKQMPREMQEIYEWSSEQMRNDNCILIALRNSNKKICAHLLIDKTYYRSTYKASQKDDLEWIAWSINQNFIKPLENMINGKEA